MDRLGNPTGRSFKGVSEESEEPEEIQELGGGSGLR